MPRSDIPRLARFIRQGLLLALAIIPVHILIAQEEAPYTLHVYTNLLQLPTLVLSGTKDPLPPLTADQFTLRLDSGPPFHPLSLRRQGDDPMSVAIVIDNSYPEGSFYKLDEAFGSLAPLSLTARDQVTVFAVDCTVIRIPGMIPAAPDTLQQAVAQTLNAPNLHGSNGKKSGCLDKIRLWDTFALAARELSTQPGRRVILALSTSYDQSSANSWHDVLNFAHNNNITIFAIRDRRPGIGVGFARRYYAEDPLIDLCTSSGGLVLTSEPKNLAATLRHGVELLRGRYILEFQRPSNATPGGHQIDVKVPFRGATVLASGIRASLPDDALVNDPNTVPTDTSRAPTLGTRRPITKPR